MIFTNFLLYSNQHSPSYPGVGTLGRPLFLPNNFRRNFSLPIFSGLDERFRLWHFLVNCGGMSLSNTLLERGVDVARVPLTRMASLTASNSAGVAAEQHAITIALRQKRYAKALGYVTKKVSVNKTCAVQLRIQKRPSYLLHWECCPLRL